MITFTFKLPVSNHNNSMAAVRTSDLGAYDSQPRLTNSLWQQEAARKQTNAVYADMSASFTQELMDDPRLLLQSLTIESR
jgi:hypothetical protein